VNKFIYNYLRDKQITQAEFAKAVGVSQGQVNLWLHGKTSTSMKTLQKLAKVLSVSMDDLVREFTKN